MFYNRQKLVSQVIILAI